MNQPVAAQSLMRQSAGASYHHWLLACDRWLEAETQGVIMGTYALMVSDWQWQIAYEADLLPSEAVEAVTRWLESGGEA